VTISLVLAGLLHLPEPYTHHASIRGSIIDPEFDLVLRPGIQIERDRVSSYRLVLGGAVASGAARREPAAPR
jgi:hypothetical protein